MQAIGFYILLPFLYLISILPFFLLYLISDLCYFLVYPVFGYRKKVVRTNLKNSFPEKSEEELKVIEKKFYHHFCDLLVESVKALTISERQIRKRCRFREGAMDIFNQLYTDGKHCTVMMGHFGNWEWSGLSMSSQSPYLLKVIYRELSNQHFDRLVFNLRKRFNAQPLEMDNVSKEMLKRSLPLSCTVFIADQTPLPEGALWINFLHQDTPFFQGAEKLSRRLNYPVLYAAVKKAERGFYEITIETLCENSSTTIEGEITALFGQRLEKDIISQPEIWLWSHRRWKHRRK